MDTQASTKQKSWWPSTTGGRMLCLDYTSYADASDCLVSFSCLTPFHRSPCTIQSREGVSIVSCTIQSGSFGCGVLYDINLRATHTTIPSTRGVEIRISLVSSATDSIWRRVVVFKLYLYRPQTLSLSSCVNRV